MAFNTSSGFIGVTNEATLALYGGTEIAAALDAYLGSSAWRSDSGIVAGMGLSSVRVAANTNITLSGEQTINGVALTAGDKVLCTAQTTGSQNGTYVVATGAWTRADTTINENNWWWAEGGTNGPAVWTVTTADPIVVGTTAIIIVTALVFTVHASTHAAAGADPLTLSQSQITNLTTDLGNKQAASAALTAVSGAGENTIIGRKAGGSVAALALTTLDADTTPGSSDYIPIWKASGELKRVAANLVGAAYADESAQDAVGNILTDTASINFTYEDSTPAIKADVIFGTTGTTACVGNDSRLHTRSHTMTSTSDHTAGNWKAFYTNGSGQVQELALGASGEVLTSNGPAAAPTFSAASIPGDEAYQDAIGGILTDTASINFTYEDSTPAIKADVIFGTTGNTACVGNDSRLHTRLHSMADVLDHSATAWRVFYSNGSGQVTELALGADGTYLRSGGASAAPTFGTPPGGEHPLAHGDRTVLTSDSGAVARTLATRFADIKNVLDFDAKADNSTNDRTAFANAIAAAAVKGGLVYIPGGAYRVGAAGDATLSIPSNVSIWADQQAIIDWRGTGYCLTLTAGTMLAFIGGTWKYNNAAVDADGERGIWKINSTAGNITRCVWHHMYIIGNPVHGSLGAEDYGMWISGSQTSGQQYSAYYNTISECRIDYCQNGIRFWPGAGAQYNSQPNAWNLHHNLFFECFYDVAFPKNTGAVRYYGTDEFVLRDNFHASTGGSTSTGGAVLIEGWENQEDPLPAVANRGPIYIDMHDSVENAGRGIVVTGAQYLKFNSFVLQPANTYGEAIVTDYSTGGVSNALPPGNTLTINTRRVDWPRDETPIANGAGATNPASLETMRVWANNTKMTCTSPTNIKFVHLMASPSIVDSDSEWYVWHADTNCTYIDASETVLASPAQTAGTVADWPNNTYSLAIRTPGYKRYTPAGGEIVKIKYHAAAGAVTLAPVNIARESPLKTVAITGATNLSGQSHQGKLLQNTNALTLTILNTTKFSAFGECQLYAAGGALTVAAGSGVTIHSQSGLVVPEQGRALLLATDVTDTYILSIIEKPISLDDLSDVTITSPTHGQTIKYDSVGGVWKNDTVLANMAQDTIKGRKTASTGAPEDCTAAEARAIIEKSPSRVISSVSGSLTTAAHNGAILLTSGNVTVPNAAGDVGFSATLVMGGAHTITFNGTVSAAMTSGDIVTLIVTSTTAIKAVKTSAANLVSFT